MSEPGDNRDGQVPDLSIVIASFNASKTLADQLEALTAESWGGTWEIIVVDNNSTDSTFDLANRVALNCPRLRIVRATDGQGPSYARNAGARAAIGRSLAFCDADDVIASGWVGAMGEALATNEFVTGPVELELLNPTWLASSKGTSGTNDLVWFDDLFPFASSCNLGVGRERFLAMGGFDETLAVGEDIELSLRLHLAAIQLQFRDEATIHYRYRAGTADSFRQAIAYGAARPVIAERLVKLGGKQADRWNGARNWAWLLRHIALLGNRAGRSRWLWVAGQRIGSLKGSVKVRRLYL
ncbi:MAG: glycosyltransferase [Acidimicrobiia bacterium]|nr:glycosyltransferase [Acidimicrobiia bacterium]